MAKNGASTSRGLFGGQPQGLSTLFFTELWERFSYYGMRALLTLFIVAPIAAGGLGLSTVEAARIYGNYTMAVYLLAIPGGFIADRYLGAHRSVLIGGSTIALGHFALAVPTLWGFYLGLCLVALGTGLFKPNISALVGRLYAPGDDRRDAGFSIFYMGINIGGLLAPLITGFLAQSAWFKQWLAANGFDPASSWHWGFAAAGIGMTIGLLLYMRRMSTLDPRLTAAPSTSREISSPDTSSHDPSSLRSALLVAGGTLAILVLTLLSDRPELQWLRGLFLLLPAGACIFFAMHGTLAAKHLAAMFVLFIASMIFWGIFEQAGITIALFAQELTRNEVLGWSFPAAWYQSLNPLFVILLAPLFATLWLRLGSRQPSSPVKFVLGLSFLAASFLLMVPAAMLTAEGRISPLWLVGLFFLQTTGELLLSPVGLSTMTKLAPPHLVGLVLGVWFLSMAWGNKIAGILGAGYDSADPSALAGFFLQQALMVGVATALLIALVPWLKSLMRDLR
ncbi:peptide MFS transporter [Hyphomicrobium sp. D-2]|uniref:peptide MFS transporter n=1 Tax=Hyphomicrobium sp. D-2 TaxID=3041621 RepID=UPI0024575879|nr:peptide MFS transporter [Hyphomicrobium sp. D-2]MDH4983010.1 peptide MFS transporter [Hyphomicrobium sp. D-2]